MDDELKMTEEQTEVKKTSGQIQEKWRAGKQIVKLKILCFFSFFAFYIKNAKVQQNTKYKSK